MPRWWTRCSLVARVLAKFSRSLLKSDQKVSEGHGTEGEWVADELHHDAQALVARAIGQADDSVVPGSGVTAVECHEFGGFNKNAVMGLPAPLSEHLHTDWLLHTLEADDVHFSEGASTKADWATFTKTVAQPRGGQKGRHTRHVLVTVAVCVGCYGPVGE